MKKCYYLLMVMLMALVSVGLASCGDDDEPKGADIVGTWAVETNMIADYGILCQFTKDGKFHEVQISIFEGKTLVNYACHGTYTVSGNKLTVTYIYENETETVKCDYSVQGDKMMFYIDGEESPVTLTRVKDSAIEPYL